MPGGDVYRYGYDPDGTRVRSTHQPAVGAASTERFLHSFSEIGGVFDGGGALTEYVTHGPRLDEPLAVERGGATDYLQSDGSPPRRGPAVSIEPLCSRLAAGERAPCPGRNDHPSIP